MGEVRERQRNISLVIDRMALYGAIFQGLVRAMGVPPRGRVGSIANKKRRAMLPAVRAEAWQTVSVIAALAARGKRA